MFCRRDNKLFFSQVHFVGYAFLVMLFIVSYQSFSLAQIETVTPGKKILIAQWLANQGVENPNAVIRKFPRILYSSNEDKLDGHVAWMKSVGFQDIARVINIAPQVLGLSVESSLKPKLDWLKDIGVENPVMLLERFPILLTLNLENNLKETWNEMSHFWNIDISDFNKKPQLFGASLKRIQLMRQFLDTIARWAGEESFPISSLSKVRRITIIQRMSVEFILEYFRQSNIIRSEVTDIAELNVQEKNTIVNLYRSGIFQKDLIPRGKLGALSRSKTPLYCGKVLE
ncbi:MAG TPA: hypothetical protein PLU50_10035 [Pseudobdellovibrionaceae bacterium]|jgi:hypothetical protein|nr:hypothetical protein [Pseudobdellovibrionaceae bacterium]